MNKITRKQNSLYCDNLIRKFHNIDFIVVPRDINEEKREYKHWYQSVHKKKLGKAKRISYNG